MNSDEKNTVELDDFHLAEKSALKKETDLKDHNVFVDDIKYQSNEYAQPSLSGVATSGENGSKERVRRDFSPDNEDPVKNVSEKYQEDRTQQFEEGKNLIQARNSGYQPRGEGVRPYYQNYQRSQKGTGPFMNPTSYRRNSARLSDGAGSQSGEFQFPSHSTGSNYVLTENNQILKAINMNKMQHQYIQNLQKANMTLKCKIKEVSELQSDPNFEGKSKLQNLVAYSAKDSSDDQEALNDVDDDEFEMQILGTIEEIHQAREKKKQAHKKDREFYDRHSLGRGASRGKSQHKYQVKQKREPAPAHEDDHHNKRHQVQGRNDSKYEDEFEERDYRQDPRYQRGYESQKNRHHEDYYSQPRYEGNYHPRERVQRYEDIPQSRGHHHRGYETRGYHGQYQNRYERMNPNTRHAEESRYHHDYQRSYSDRELYLFEHYDRRDRHEQRQYSEDEYYDYHLVQEYSDQDSYHSSDYEVQGPERPRYQRDLSQRKYLVFVEGKVQINPRRGLNQKSVWKTKDASSSAKSSGQDEFSDLQPSRVPQKKNSKAVVPAVQPSQKKKTKDLRPAVFIKDLKKRSLALEEEKAQRKQDAQNQKSFGSKKDGRDRNSTEKSLNEAEMLVKAAERGDMKELTEALYKAKLNNQGQKQGQKILAEAISKAEKTLVRLSSMS